MSVRARLGPGRRGALGLLAALLVATVGLVGRPAPVAGQEDDADERPPVLVDQRTFVGTGDTFELRLDPASVPPDGSVELVLRGRVLSRSELERSAEGSGLRSAIYGPVGQAVSTLPTAADGSLRLTISFDPEEPGGLSLRTAGVYPLEVRARSADNELLGTLVTHLVREPDEDDESPPLSVVVLARTLDRPALDPSGDRLLDDDELAEAAAWLAPIAASDVPVGLVLAPDALLAVAARALGPDPTAVEVLEALRQIAGTGAVLTVPYAPTTPDALAAAGLDDELARHLDTARRTVRDVLEVAPDPTWLATPDLSEDGVRALAGLGVEHLVVGEEQLEPLRAGLLSLSLAQPFLVGPDRATALDALSVDERVLTHLDTSLSPGLEANRLLSELAMLWFEQPGIPRAAVVPLDGDVRPEAVTAVLQALGDTDVLQATTPDAAFDAAQPLTQPGGGRVDRALEPDDPDGIAGPVRRGLAGGRAQLAGVAALLGAADPAPGETPSANGARARIEAAEAHLLLATSTALRRDDQEAHLAAVGSEADQLVAAVTAPEHETVTLTARDGRVPMTIRNDGDVPLHVVVHLASTKLEFPEGSSMPLVLEPGSTRVDVAVRARTSGSIPLEATLTSPDGSLVLAEIDYSIRSTAVAGVGVVLSAGAALFLLVWWARHWHRTRRSAKLVEAKHLSHPSVRRSPGPEPEAG